MQQTTANVSARKLWTIPGGIHPPDQKAQSLTQPLGQAGLPKRLTIPLQQHLGAPAKPLVSVGERVLKGQMIGEPAGFISAAVHASSSGTVVEIGEFPIPHPSGLSGPCIVIETDGKDEWVELPQPVTDFTSLEKEEIIRRVRDAGIVGMGGASFPSSVKLSPPPGQKIHTLIINGVECEPFITCDDLLMRNRADRIVQGIRIMSHVLGVENCMIGIEDNKPEAAAAMNKAVQDAGLKNTEVVVIPTRYPSGGEKQLIYILTGKEVPTGGLPGHIGFVCHNVGTTAAVADAVLEGKPLISRYLTLTGEGIAEPRNLEVLVGTPVEELVSQAGGYTEKASRLILGGPMMGVSMPHDTIPVVKATNCILSPSAEEVPYPGAANACIRCMRCVTACPMSLLPQKMYWHVRSTAMDRAKHYNLFDCIECGCCSHVCPSRIPLVQYFRHGKSACRMEDVANQKADVARQRTEARTARLERLEAEKKAKMEAKKKAAAAKKAAAEKKAPEEATAGESPDKAATDAETSDKQDA
jgi:electron transport complex protein RnfC